MVEWIIASSALIGVLILLRHFLRGKISLRLQYALWLLVLLRLLLPFSFGESLLSVQNALKPVGAAEQVIADSYLWYGSDNAPPQSALDPDDTSTAAVEKTPAPSLHLAPYQEANAAATAMPLVRLSSILLIIWLSGAIVTAACFLHANLRFARRLKQTRKRAMIEHYPLPVYLSDIVETPCLYGLFQPAVYLTRGALASAATLSHVLEHEATHYRHRDHLWAILRCACLTLHWYNPLVWWAAALSRRDAELACDEAAIQRIGEQAREEYGRTLISLTCTQQKASALLSTATTMIGSKNSIKERITLIAKKPKMAVYTLITVVLIAAITMGCTFTGEKKPPVAAGINVDAVQDLPAEVLAYATDYVQTQIDYLNEVGADPVNTMGPYTIIDAKITGLTQMNADITAGGNNLCLYQLEYRLLPDAPDNVMLVGGMQMEDGWITEWGSTGQPHLLLAAENAADALLWQKICVTNTDEITVEYSTPELLARYGDAYTAAAMELYRASLSGEAVDLYAAADDAVKDYMDSGWWYGGELPMGEYTTAAFTPLYEEQVAGESILYGVSLYRSYDRFASGFTVVRSFQCECIITLDALSGAVNDFWVPGDGAYHDMDIAARFPAAAAEQILADPLRFYLEYESTLATECDARAAEYFGVDSSAALGQGETRTYSYQNLQIELTKVKSDRIETMLDDGGNEHQYTVITYYPGAMLTVIEADMSDPAYSEDGKPHANWGILSDPSGYRKIRITDDFSSLPVTSAMKGIYSLEASLYVFRFEAAVE